MATLVRINVTDPQNILDTYGAGALVRLERDTVAAMTNPAAVTTIPVVAGTTEYEYRDEAGIAGTHYYRTRFSKASPSVGADYSGYSAVWLAGALTGEVITLEAAKGWLGVDDTVDDEWLPLAVQAVNRAIIRAVGIDLGPSPDSVRVFDGCDATRYGTRLRIPGGIRAFTTVEVRSGTTWTDITADVRLGPRSWEKPPDEPYGYIEFAEDPVTRSTFPRGLGDVRITGAAFATFGWDAWPADVVQDGVAALQRMTLDRSRGGQYPSEIAAMRYLHLPVHHAYRALYFPMVL